MSDRTFVDGSVGKVVQRGLALLAVGGALLAARPAQARYISVTQLGERVSGNTGCTLREAIQAVNTQSSVKQCGAWDGGAETIRLSSGTYTVRLNSSADTLRITRPVTIQGNGYNATIVTRASGSANLFEVASTSGWVTFQALRLEGLSDSHALVVNANAWTQLNYVHVRNSGNGNNSTYGCVKNLGNLFATGVEISNCQGWEASGIYNTGLLVMDQSAILEGGYGARAGAINNVGPSAQASLSNTTIAKNKASANCSALCNQLGAQADLSQVTVVYNFRDPQSSFSSDSVTALRSDSQSTLTIRNSLVSSNYNKLLFFPPTSSPNPNCAGSTITSAGYNFLGDPNDVETSGTTSPACVPNVTNGTDRSGGTLALDKASGNLPKSIGGATRAYRPLSVSGNPVLGMLPDSECWATDQRGMGRHDYSFCEAGAVSVGHATVIVGSATSPSSADNTLKTWLEALGFFVYFVDDNAPAENLGNPGLTIAVISSSVVDSTLANKYRSAPIGVVVNKVEQLDNLRMIASGNYGTSSSAEPIGLGEDYLSFGAKLGNTLISSFSSGGSSWANVAGYDWIAYNLNQGGYPMVYYPQNTTGDAGFVMPGARISFPGVSSFFTGGATTAGKRMFEEAALWASRQHP